MSSASRESSVPPSMRRASTTQPYRTWSESQFNDNKGSAMAHHHRRVVSHVPTPQYTRHASLHRPAVVLENEPVVSKRKKPSRPPTGCCTKFLKYSREFFLHIGFPLLVLLASVMRLRFFSVLYFLILFCPLAIPIFRSRAPSVAASRKALILLIITSFVACIGHAIFHLFRNHRDEFAYKLCLFFGLAQMNSFGDVIKTVGLDAVVLLVSIPALIFRVSSKRSPDLFPGALYRILHQYKLYKYCLFFSLFGASIVSASAYDTVYFIHWLTGLWRWSTTDTNRAQVLRLQPSLKLPLRWRLLAIYSFLQLLTMSILHACSEPISRGGPGWIDINVNARVLYGIPDPGYVSYALHMIAVILLLMLGLWKTETERQLSSKGYRIEGDILERKNALERSSMNTALLSDYTPENQRSSRGSVGSLDDDLDIIPRCHRRYVSQDIIPEESMDDGEYASDNDEHERRLSDGSYTLIYEGEDYDEKHRRNTSAGYLNGCLKEFWLSVVVLRESAFFSFLVTILGVSGLLLWAFTSQSVLGCGVLILLFVGITLSAYPNTSNYTRPTSKFAFQILCFSSFGEYVYGYLPFDPIPQAQIHSDHGISLAVGWTRWPNVNDQYKGLVRTSIALLMYSLFYRYKQLRSDKPSRNAAKAVYTEKQVAAFGVFVALARYVCVFLLCIVALRATDRFHNGLFLIALVLVIWPSIHANHWLPIAVGSQVILCIGYGSMVAADQFEKVHVWFKDHDLGLDFLLDSIHEVLFHSALCVVSLLVLYMRQSDIFLFYCQFMQGSSHIGNDKAMVVTEEEEYLGNVRRRKTARTEKKETKSSAINQDHIAIQEGPNDEHVSPNSMSSSSAAASLPTLGGDRLTSAPPSPDSPTAPRAHLFMRMRSDKALLLDNQEDKIEKIVLRSKRRVNEAFKYVESIIRWLFVTVVLYAYSGFHYILQEYGVYMCYLFLLLDVMVRKPSVIGAAYVIFLITVILLHQLVSKQMRIKLIRLLWPFLVAYTFTQLLLRYVYHTSGGFRNAVHDLGDNAAVIIGFSYSLDHDTSAVIMMSLFESLMLFCSILLQSSVFFLNRYERCNHVSATTPWAMKNVQLRHQLAEESRRKASVIVHTHFDRVRAETNSPDAPSDIDGKSSTDNGNTDEKQHGNIETHSTTTKSLEEKDASAIKPQRRTCCSRISRFIASIVDLVVVKMPSFFTDVGLVLLVVTLLVVAVMYGSVLNVVDLAFALAYLLILLDGGGEKLLLLFVLSNILTQYLYQLFIHHVSGDRQELLDWIGVRSNYSIVGQILIVLAVVVQLQLIYWKKLAHERLARSGLLREAENGLDGNFGLATDRRDSEIGEILPGLFSVQEEERTTQDNDQDRYAEDRFLEQDNSFLVDEDERNTGLDALIQQVDSKEVELRRWSQRNLPPPRQPSDTTTLDNTSQAGSLPYVDHETVNQNDDDDDDDDKPYVFAWFQTLVLTLRSGHTLEFTYVVLMVSIFCRRDATACVDLLIVGVCMYMNVAYVRRLWRYLTWWWVVLFIAKWLVGLFPPPLTSYRAPWQDWSVDVQEFLVVKRSTNWFFDFLALLVVAFQQRAFSKSTYFLDEDEDEDEQTSDISYEHIKKTKWHARAVKIFLLLVMIFVFLVGAIDAVNAGEMNLFAFGYICTALYLYNYSHMWQDPKKSKLWTGLKICNFFILLVKLMFHAPYFHHLPERSSSWRHFSSFLGLDREQAFAFARVLPDLVVYTLIGVQTRLSQLSRFRNLVYHEHLTLRKHYLRYLALQSRDKCKRRMIMLETMIAYLERQQRYHDRWRMDDGKSSEGGNGGIGVHHGDVDIAQILNKLRQFGFELRVVGPVTSNQVTTETRNEEIDLDRLSDHDAKVNINTNTNAHAHAGAESTQSVLTLSDIVQQMKEERNVLQVEYEELKENLEAYSYEDISIEDLFEDQFYNYEADMFYFMENRNTKDAHSPTSLASVASAASSASPASPASQRSDTSWDMISSQSQDENDTTPQVSPSSSEQSRHRTAPSHSLTHKATITANNSDESLVKLGKLDDDTDTVEHDEDDDGTSTCTKYINDLVYYLRSNSDQPALSKSDDSALTFQLAKALYLWLSGRTLTWCMFGFILNFIVYHNLMSAVFPALTFLYIITQPPENVTCTFWKNVLYYVEFLILFKAIILFEFCHDWGITNELRGFFYYPAGPKDSFFYDVLMDFLVVILLLSHRRVLFLRGEWVTNDQEYDFRYGENRIYEEPSNRDRAPGVKSQKPLSLNTAVHAYSPPSVTDVPSSSQRYLQSDRQTNDSPTDSTQNSSPDPPLPPPPTPPRQPPPHVPLDNLAVDPDSNDENSLREGKYDRKANPKDNQRLTTLTLLQHGDDLGKLGGTSEEIDEDEEEEEGLIDLLTNYYARLSKQKPEKTRDFYMTIFSLECFFFLLIVIFFRLFSGSQSDSLGTSLSENRVPVQYFLAMFAQFIIIIIDRIIYLRSSIKAKAWFQLIHVVMLHFLLFFYYPGYRGFGLWRNNSSDRVLLVCYVVKCAYFYYSARQIQHGYPPFSKSQYLTKEVNYYGYLRYLLYRLIPFLFELKTILDWTCTDSPLLLYDWLKLEDILGNIYLVNCDMTIRKSWGRQRGDLYPFSWKTPVGCCLVFLMVLVLWGPFVIYLTGIPLGSTNSVTRASISITVQVDYSAYQLFKTSEVQKMSNYTVDQIKNFAIEDLRAFSNGEVYVQRLQMQPDSAELWAITPPSKKSLIKDLKEHYAVTLSMDLSFDRRTGTSIGITTERKLSQEETDSMLAVLNGTRQNFVVERMFPMLYRLSSSGSVSTFGSDQVDCILHQVQDSENGQVWWSVGTMQFPNVTSAWMMAEETKDPAYQNSRELLSWPSDTSERVPETSNDQYNGVTDIGQALHSIYLHEENELWDRVMPLSSIPLSSRKASSLVASLSDVDTFKNRISGKQYFDHSEGGADNVSSRSSDYNEDRDYGHGTVVGSGMTFFTISDKSFLGLLSSAFYDYSIITIYFTFVLAVGRFLRIAVLGMSQRIIYEDIPNPHFICELVDDIYSARWDREHALEETMYGELVQLYRSPATMIEKTLPNEPLVGVTNYPYDGRIAGEKEKKE